VYYGALVIGIRWEGMDGIGERIMNEGILDQKSILQMYFRRKCEKD